jgi:hypothetical protein
MDYLLFLGVDTDTMNPPNPPFPHRGGQAAKGGQYKEHDFSD